MSPGQIAAVRRAYAELGRALGDETTNPAVLSRSSEGDAVRAAATLLDRFDGRASLAVSHHSPGQVDIQVSYTSGAQRPAQDRSRWDGIRLVAAELGRPLFIDQHKGGYITTALTVEIDGVAVKCWSMIVSPQVIEKIQGPAADVDG
ncbi:hypothetical protein [Frankia sp. AvcI1]|uniref:hypothetical protein n=1 Tax=Frankia sp. AvcI1 TaxID=573496 RepID=UPI0021187415|nr:hypothetical protein [Frankia sp. AvcI1]